MPRFLFVVLCPILFLCPFFVEAEEGSLAGYRYLGPSDIVVGDDPDLLFILEKDARQIRKIRIGTAEKPAGKPEILSLPILPERMSIFPDKKYLSIVGGGPLGRLLIVEMETLKIKASVAVGHSPSDVALFSDDLECRAYVSNRFSGDISVVKINADRARAEEVRRFVAGREPIALAVTPDGQTLVVAGQIPEDVATNNDTAARVRIIDTQSGETTNLRLPSGAINLRDVELDASGRYAFISGTIGHFEQLPSHVSGGWMNENVLFAIDLCQRQLANLFYVDDYSTGSGNPWGITMSDDKRFLVVSLAGSCEVILLTMWKVLDILENRPENNFRDENKVGKPEHAIDSKLPIRMRIPVALKGIRHAVMSRNRVVATAYFEDCLVQIVPCFTEPIRFVPGLSLSKGTLEIPSKRLLRNDSDSRYFGEAGSFQNPYEMNRRYVDAAHSNSRALRFNRILADQMPDAGIAVDAEAYRDPVEAKRLKNQTVSVVVSTVDSEVEENTPLRFIPLPPYDISQGIRFERSFARLGPEPIWSDVRYGEMLFHDAILCFEHWQSCSTCHPDARADSLNWDLLNDGHGNPKNTKSMLLAHETPPSMVTGVRPNAETAVRKGFESILFIMPTEEEAVAVDAYLKSLKPVPSPRLVFDLKKEGDEGTLSESAKRGKRLFESSRTGCSGCHPAPLFTDMRKHDVGSQASNDSEPFFDTPTLVEIWRTAPYLHDGRYQTVRETIVDGKHVNSKGRLDQLTEMEIDDLVEYVLSL